MDRDAAQQRVNQIRAFRAELDALKAAGISPIDPEQESAISRYHDQLLQRLATQYDVDRTDSAGQLSRGMRLLSFFGAVALTAAVYSLVERFWGRIDVPLQAALLAAFPLMALVGVELSARRERTLYVSALFALVAYGTFWLAAAVLSATLNIPLTPILIWAGVCFGLPLAIVYGFRIVLAATLVALVTAVAGTMFQASGLEWTAILDKLDVLMVAGFSLMLLVPQLSRIDHSFAPATRIVALTIGLGSLLVLSASGANSLIALGARTVEAIYQVVMLAASVTLIVFGVRRRWNETVNVASVMLALFLLTRFVDWFWDLLPRYIFFLLLAALAFAWLLILRKVRGRLAQAA